MGWTSLPVKKETKEQIESLNDKDGRDWDTFLRRAILGENIDGEPRGESKIPSITLFQTPEKVDEIQEAVDSANETTLINYHSGDKKQLEVGDWLEYNIVEREHQISGETEYLHIVDFSNVPPEIDGFKLAERQMSMLQSELQKRAYFVLDVDFEDEGFLIQHTDLIRRRLDRGVNHE